MNRNKKLWILLGLLFAVTLGTVLLSIYYIPDSARSRAISQEIRIQRKLHDTLRDALEAFSTGKYKEAEMLVNTVIENSTDSIPAWSLKGLICYNSGRYRQAVAAYQKVLFFAPSNASVYNNLAMAQLALGDYASAEENLKKSLAINPEAGRAHVNLARVYYLQKDDSRTLACLVLAHKSLAEQFELYVSKEMFERLGASPEFLGLFGAARVQGGN